MTGSRGGSSSEGLSIRGLFGSNLARETLWTFGLKGVHVGLGFLVAVALARFLGASGYGIYSYAYALILILALPAQAGLPHLIVRETSRGFARNELGGVRRVWLWSARQVGVTTLVLVFILGPLFVVWKGGLADIEGRTMAWALALIPLVALANLGGAALRGMKHVLAGQIPEFVLRPGAFALLLGAIGFLTMREISPEGAMAIHVGAAVVALFGAGVMLWRLTPARLWRAPYRGDKAGLLRASLFFALLMGSQVIIAQTDVVMLGLFETPDQVGIYKVAVQVATLASVGMHMVNVVLAPRFADLYAATKLDRLQRLATAGARVGLAVNLLITVTFLVLGSSFLSFAFGADFASSFAPLVVLLVGQVVSTAAGSAGNLLNMSGHEDITAKTMAITAAVNIVLNLVLIPLWGLLGAASATAVARVFWSAWLVRRTRSAIGINSRAFNTRISFL